MDEKLFSEFYAEIERMEPVFRYLLAAQQRGKDKVGMSSLRQSVATVATPARKPTEELDESAKLTADAERQMLDLPAAEAEALAPVVINLDVRLARPGGPVTVNQHDLPIPLEVVGCVPENESFLPHPIQKGLPVPTQLLGGELQGIPVMPHRL